MAVNVAHRRAPKIVLQEGGQRGLGEHVLVPHHRGYIVVHEITTQRVQVTGDSDQSDRRVNAPHGRFAPLRVVAATDPPAALAAATVITSSHDSRWGWSNRRLERSSAIVGNEDRTSSHRAALLSRVAICRPDKSSSSKVATVHRGAIRSMIASQTPR